MKDTDTYLGELGKDAPKTLDIRAQAAFRNGCNKLYVIETVRGTELYAGRSKTRTVKFTAGWILKATENHFNKARTHVEA